MLLWFAIVSLFASCIYEDEVPCPCEVRFVYDYNMEFTDAFPKQVNNVILFVFDAGSRYLLSQQVKEERLDADYKMTLNLSPGNYQLVAWAGNCKETSCYNLTKDLQPGISTLDDLLLKLNCNGSVYQKKLANLWHGMLTDFVVAEDAPVSRTISLVKDVKRFKVLLQTADGRQLAADDYSFAIVADNYRVKYDNMLLPCTEMDYIPYRQEEVVIENDADANGRAAGDVSAIVSEMGTMRLLENKTSRFIVRNEKEQKDILNISLVKYLDMMRFDEYDGMPLQEYLDREEHYQIILIMSKDTSTDAEVMLSMKINNWRLVFNQTDL